MPTPVSNARACLAAEAAAALDDAVAVARRRAHVQTTSLHVVYALLHSSSAAAPAGGSGGGAGTSSAASCPILRDALSRARSSVYSPRLQFKALDLCFGVALDRLPSSSSGQRQTGEVGGDEPPVSNSLMAAIKRSQANQRRNPETFHLYQQQQQSAAAGGASSFPGVKVELQQLVLAILDDPVVSRVFGDAGFRSTDIKFAILRPPPPILRFPRATRCPPLFLCNFSAGDGFEAALTPLRPVLPFSPAAGHLCSDGGDENCRRIGDILARKEGGRNPMLVGVGAGEAARDFHLAVERQNWTILPPELRGIELLSIEKAAVELKPGSVDLSSVDARLEEMGRKGEAPGVVLNIGDLKDMVDGNAECDERERCLVSELTRLLEVYHGRLWVMGWSATYETYMKFLSRHPLLDKDWNLQLLPITSVRSGKGGSLTRPPSLMKSFVPLGGFFPTAYESKDPLLSVHPSSRCQHCDEKYEEEVSIILKGRSASVDQRDARLPFWLHQSNKVDLNDGSNAAKAEDDKTILNAKIMELQTKWNQNCQRLHNSCQRITDNFSGIPCALDPSCVLGVERACNKGSENPDETQNQRGFGTSLTMSVGTQKISMASQSISLPSVMEPRNKDLLSKLQVKFSKSEQLQKEGFQSYQGDDHASPSSVTSVTTDLVLGSLPESLSKEESPASKVKEGPLKEHFSCLPSADTVKTNVSGVPVSSFAYSGCHDSWAKSIYPSIPTQLSNGRTSTSDKPLLISSSIGKKFGLSNYKSFCKSLIDKVGRQEDAAIAVSQAIFHCRAGERRRGANWRGDIWLSFNGPDKIGKRKVAAALAELIYGSRQDNFICIDLSYQDGVARPNTICDQQEVSENDVQSRGKLNTDLIAAELRKKPHSVVFLDNVDKADPLVQNSLSQAIHTGRFPDSHGREFSINNAIFILSSGRTQGQNFSQKIDCNSFCEETILAAQSWQMKIFLEPSQEHISSSSKSNKVSCASSQELRYNQVYLQTDFSRKRKLDVYDDCNSHCETLISPKRARTVSKEFLDLNLPVEEIEANDHDSSSHGEYSKSQNSDPWIKEFFDLVDATINFRPFDFDALAKNLLKDISHIFCRAFGSESLLEIDQKVMEEILAVAWSLEDRGALDNWFEQVLGRSIIKAKHWSNLSSHHNVLRLVACEDASVDKYAPGVLLPLEIIIN
ncbi:hypothetical protein Cni_G13084 [Canna indica]|uniref:Clp R domain-containing protein n=1 Tax=Canna indica TaxID=4628 RepID=A0AAQ3QCS9_9LILI|nr:hypothetical protein Cni_G13084 [Canna indica]